MRIILKKDSNTPKLLVYNHMHMITCAKELTNHVIHHPQDIALIVLLLFTIVFDSPCKTILTSTTQSLLILCILTIVQSFMF